MIIYRAPVRTVRPGDVWRWAGADPLRFLIEFGEIEAAIADRLCPELDETTDEIERLRKVSMAAARGTRPIAQIDLPGQSITVSVPEGYAYYGLNPGTYVKASQMFWDEKQPPDVVVVGIRSIGTSLSALVAAALERRGVRVFSFTVRPRGHPFARRLCIGPALEQTWRALGHAYFAIVDEGPGLSGSSFACVAARLTELGIPDHRIIFLPSWTPDGNEFVNEQARLRWKRHVKYCCNPVPPAHDLDLSAGRWRSLVYEDESAYPEVCPQHEPRKYLLTESGCDWLLKFEGLGCYGEARFERAKVLASAGYSPEPCEISDGYMRTEFVRGRPLSRCDCNSELLERIAQYLAFRAAHFPAESATPLEGLKHMIEVNCPAAKIADPDVTARPVIVDGRMMPHEWIATGRGYLKTDAVDHGDNHFYPGPTDIAWDLAGAIAEFHLEAAESEYFIHRYIHHSGDCQVAARLPFFRIAYEAFRAGYRKMFFPQEVATAR